MIPRFSLSLQALVSGLSTIGIAAVAVALIGLGHGCVPDFEKLQQCNADNRDGKSECYSCDNGIKDANETDVDCGGACSNECVKGDNCKKNSDCETGYCGEGSKCDTKPVCENGVKDDNESDVDCGGESDCPRCDPGDACASANDCKSGDSCQSKRCVDIDPCENRIQDGSETDIDCGGSCDKCEADSACKIDADCESNNCDTVGSDNTKLCLPSCEDGRKNRDETDVDCGGLECDACGLDLLCKENTDCVSDNCVNSKCVELPGCSNGRQDGQESDKDCGGQCALCGLGRGCNFDADCKTGLCGDDGKCAPSCSDGEKDGTETDVDCGATCAPDRRCGLDQACLTAADCGSFICTNKKCGEAPAVASYLMIDDMEDGNRTISKNGPEGNQWGPTEWTEHGDGQGTRLGDAPTPSATDDAKSGSEYIMHFGGEGFSQWGDSLIMKFQPNGAASTTYDASGFTGIQFWARSSKSSDTIRMQFPDLNTQNGLGVCDSSENVAQAQADCMSGVSNVCQSCDNWHTYELSITAEWRLYQVRFDSATQYEWGSPRVANVDAEHLYGLRFGSPIGGAFDFYIDDLAFYE